MKDSTEFKQRFAAWKAGKKVYDAGKPIPKYDGGTGDKTYLPEYEYEATVTPQGVSAEKHKRITNEEDWQKYWGNVGAGYVNKALESVAKPILEGLKTASYFTPLGNATAFGDLLAANINGDKDETLASAAGLLPQVRWARNAYKAGKQLMSLNQLWDRHYFHALNDKDLRGVKNLRDAHFIVNAPNTKIKNGDLPVTLYHGTPNKGWNEYDPKFFGSNTDDGYYGKGLYLTETLDDALAYAGIKDRNFEKFTGTKNPYLKKFYVNSETPFVSGALNNDFKIATANEASDRAMLAPHFGRDLKFKIGTPGSESGTVYIPNDMIYDPTLVRELENADASIFSNVLHHVDRDPTIVKFDEVIVPKSSLMKYIDPITYDDFGNVIPLSMRDNFSNPDFRFDKGKSIHMKQRSQTPQKLYLNYDNELPNVDVVAKKLPEVQVVAPRIKTEAEKELEELKDPFALPSFEDYFNAFMESRGIMTPWSVGKYVNPLKRQVNAIKYWLPMYDEGTNNAQEARSGINYVDDYYNSAGFKARLKQTNNADYYPGYNPQFNPQNANWIVDDRGFGSSYDPNYNSIRIDPIQGSFSAGYDVHAAHERAHNHDAYNGWVHPREWNDILNIPTSDNQHDRDDHERYADLQAMRYLLNKEGIYDARKVGDDGNPIPFTLEMLDAFKKTESYKQSRFANMFDDKDIIRAMMLIASNNGTHNGMYYADKGKSIKPLLKYDDGTDDNQYYTLSELANIYKHTDAPFVILSGDAYAPRAYWDIIQKYPEEVQYRVAEINKGLSEGALDINGGELKEVVVTPTKEDKKILRLFKRAVPDKNVRNNIYERFDKDLEWRAFAGDKSNISQNERVKNLVSVWQMSKNPKMYNDVFDKLFTYPKLKIINNPKAGKPRANYRPILNKFGNIADFDDYVSELSHAYLFSPNADKKVRENILSSLLNLPGDISINGKSGYERPGNLEHTAHSIIQPLLENFIMTEKHPSVLALNDRINKRLQFLEKLHRWSSDTNISHDKGKSIKPIKKRKWRK